MNNDLPYIGNELALFEHALNWKRYFSSFFRPYIKGKMVEVGAGIGTTTPFLLNPRVESCLCIEPDVAQSDVIKTKINLGELPKICTAQQGFLSDAVHNQYDVISYIDVIEHIEDDKAELEKAANALSKGGFLCILVPANPGDYSPFDKAIGHYRRYNKEMLRNAIPSSLDIEWCRYADICGSVSSKVNKYILKQSYPNKKQISFWDKVMVRISRILDPITGYHWGKSLLLVAKKK